ncbi:MAG: hypothetical protein ABJC28_01725 [Acidobacteriota bacterium]
MVEDNRYETQPPAPSPPPAFATEPVMPRAIPAIIIEKKSPGLAGILSGIFPGLGHLYLGLYQRSFKVAAAFVGCIWIVSTGFMNGHLTPIFGMGIAFIWFFGIIDAVRQAKAINAGYIEAGGLAPEKTLSAARRESTSSLTWGVILVGMGTLWLLDRYADLDAFWAVVEDWLAPASFILFGLILITTYVIKKRRHNQAETWPPRS